MAVVFLDSANGGSAALWNAPNVGSIQTGQSPSSRSVYRLQNNGGHVLLKNITALSSVLVGWKGRISNLSNDNSTNVQIFQLLGDAAATTHMTLCITATGQIVARRGTGTGTAMATSSAGVILVDTFHHFEVRYTVNDSTGRCEIWVDDVKVIDFTGDTKNAGTNTTIDGVRFSRTNNGNWDICDISIADETVNYGITQVADMLPTGNGNSSGFTGSDGNSTDNYLLADEAVPNSDTDYVAGDTEGEKDTYVMANLPSGPSWNVLAVQVRMDARKSDAGARFVRPVFRIGSTDYAGTSVTVPETYAAIAQIYNTSPATASAWTQSEVDGMEAGAEARDS